MLISHPAGYSDDASNMTATDKHIQNTVTVNAKYTSTQNDERWRGFVVSGSTVRNSLPPIMRNPRRHWLSFMHS